MAGAKPAGGAKAAFGREMMEGCRRECCSNGTRWRVEARDGPNV